jgi:Two component regulator propeller.
VYAILEDHKGFLWFCTADGLNKYDGYQFKIYKSYSRDSSTLSSNTIRALYITLTDEEAAAYPLK